MKVGHWCPTYDGLGRTTCGNPLCEALFKAVSDMCTAYRMTRLAVLERWPELAESVVRDLKYALARRDRAKRAAKRKRLAKRAVARGRT